MKILVVSLLYLLTGALPAFALETDWRWIRVEPHDNAAPVSWSVEQGTAKNVVITGGRFTAELYEDDLAGNPKEPVIRLSGTISDGRLVASAVYIGTDAGREIYHGEVRIQAPKGDPIETDRVTLKGEWADAFIGLTRVKKTSPQP